MITQTIYVNLDEVNPYPHLRMRAGDTGRILDILILYQHSLWNVVSSWTAQFNYVRPNGTIGSLGAGDGISVITNGVRADQNAMSKIIAAPGVVKCEVVLTDASNTAVGSLRFQIMAEEQAVAMSDIAGTNEYPDLTAAVDAAKQYRDEAEVFANDSQLNANTASQAAAEATQANTEATDAADRANISAGSALGSANTASNAATEAVQAAADAEAASTAVVEYATTSQSWAIGGTSSRPGEDTNNSKYWAEQAEGFAGQVVDGTTFIPSVDQTTGIISWSNSDGKPNPPDANIKGPKGDTGTAGTVVEIGTTTTGAPGASAAVHNSSTDPAIVTLDFTVPQGLKGDTGTGIQILGTYDSLSDLQAAHPTGSPGDAYTVGTSAVKDMYVWNEDTSAWENAGSFGAGVSSFKGRMGDVNPEPGDYNADQVGAVPTSRTINGIPLTGPVNLTAAHVGAPAVADFDSLQTDFDDHADDTNIHTSLSEKNTWNAKVSTAQLANYVPTTRTVNGKALNQNISLSAADIGADASGAASAVQTNLTTHATNTTIHTSSTEKATWNAKLNGAKIQFSTVAPTPGSASPYEEGTVLFVYE